MTRARRRVAGLVAVVAAASITVAGCGGGSSDSASASTDVQEVQDCLAEHGVQLPSAGMPPSGNPPSGQPPSGDFPGGQPSQRMQEAFQACQQYAPQGAPSGGFPGPPSEKE